MDTWKELLWSEKWKRQKVTEIIAGHHETFFWKLNTFYKAWEIPRSYCLTPKHLKWPKLQNVTWNWVDFRAHCTCLENPRDGGAWWAAVSGVAQSRTWLKRLSSSMYGCESWTVRKFEQWKIDAFELWYWRRLLRVFSSTIIQKHQFFKAQPSLWSNSHICTWLLEKPQLKMVQTLTPLGTPTFP